MTVDTLSDVAHPTAGAMTIFQHIAELRRRLIVSAATFGAAAIAVYAVYGSILRILEHPYCESLGPHHACNLYVTGPLDGFAIRLDVTGYGGLIVASPIILFQLWRFITPGLRANEKRYAIPFAAACVSLFAMGAGVAWLTFPHALGFLHAAGGSSIQDLFTPAKYIGLILALMAIFGIAFEFPVVLVALELAHVITPASLSHYRRVAIIAIVVVSGVITPSSDPFSMLAMAVPMLVFYEVSIVIGRIAQHHSRAIEAKQFPKVTA